MDCQCSLAYRDAPRPCRKCLLREVERLKAGNDTYTSCIVQSNTIIADLREALEWIKTYVEGWGLEKEVHEKIDETLKDSQPEPERWACCGNERQEEHGDYCPRCS